MRKIFIIAALFCFSLFLFWKEVSGPVFKAALRWKLGFHLSYRNVQYSDGHLLFDDIVLFDLSEKPSLFRCEAEKLAIGFPLDLQFEKLHLTLSKGAVEWFLSVPPIAWSGSATEGRIDWIDETLPSALFSFQKNKQEFEEIRIWSEGKEVAIQEKGIWGKGLFSMDWKVRHLAMDQPLGWKELYRATEECRISVEKGELKHLGDPIEKISFLASYQAGIGAKWEGSGATKNFPISLEGKVSLFEARPSWGITTWSIGSGKGLGRWEEGTLSKWNWIGMGPAEISLIQDFGAAFTPEIAQWEWVSGMADGTLFWDFEKGVIDWKELKISNVQIRSKSEQTAFGCEKGNYGPEGKIDGAWLYFPSFGAFNWSGEWGSGGIDLSGMIDSHPSSISLKKKEGVWEAALKIDSNIQVEGELVFTDSMLSIDHLNGKINGLSVEGEGKWEWGKGNFSLSFPRFSGIVSDWHADKFLPFKGEGWVDSIESGFTMEGRWNDGLEISNWSLALLFDRGALSLSPSFAFSNIRFELRADPTLWDLSMVSGVSLFSAGEKTVDIPFEAPRLKIEGDLATFDFRCRRQTWDFFRLTGEKKGTEVHFDLERSHLMGRSIGIEKCLWDEKGAALLSFKSSLSLPLLQTLISDASWSEFLPIEGDLAIEGTYAREKGASLKVEGLASRWNELPFPLELKLEKSIGFLTIGPFSARGEIQGDGDGIQIKGGKGNYLGTSFEFDGKLSSELQANFTLNEVKVEASQVGSSFGSMGISTSGLQGFFEGQGFINLSPKGIEADLDLIPKNIEIQGFKFENSSPIHLFFSSSQGVVFSGLDCRIAKEEFELLGKVELCQIDAKRRHWIMQKALLHFPADLVAKRMGAIGPLFDSGKEIDLTAEIDCAFDLTELTCDVKEAFLPIGGEIRHLENLQLVYNNEQLLADFLLSHQGKQAKIKLDADVGAEIEGRLSLDELIGQEPLLIDWSFDEKGISIHAIEGNFAGINASFHAQSLEPTSQLIGTARVDFNRLSHWIPAIVGDVFQDIKMGKGYELKGHLAIGRKEFSDIRFDGILSGKQIELFGLEFRTLLGQTSLSSEQIRIYDLKISDSAGILKVDDLRIGGKKGERWTLEIPKLQIEDLRPSLLHKPQEEAGPISPLLVRKFTLANLRGILDDGKSYTGRGDLTFINSFKREETVFDFPSNIFGRIIGLDLDLLIPVKGNLSFELKEGYFNLTELKEAYSEGERSEFFLVKTEESPRVSLNGDLHILIHMKQFVLFKLTDAFMISVEGKLNDPQFRLQKKRRFLSLEF